MRDVIEQISGELARQIAGDPTVVRAIQEQAEAHANRSHELLAKRIDDAPQNRLRWLGLGVLTVGAALAWMFVVYRGGRAEGFGVVASCVTCGVGALAALAALVSDPFVPDEQAAYLRRAYGRLRSFWPRLRLHGKVMALGALLLLGVQLMAAEHERWERDHDSEIRAAAQRRIADALAGLDKTLADSTASLGTALAAKTSELTGSLEQLRAGADDAYRRIVAAADPKQSAEDRAMIAAVEASLLTAMPDARQRERAMNVLRLSTSLMTLVLSTQKTNGDIWRELETLRRRAGEIETAAGDAAAAAVAARDRAGEARQAALQAREESAAARSAAATANDRAGEAALAAKGAESAAGKASDEAVATRKAVADAHPPVIPGGSENKDDGVHDVAEPADHRDEVADVTDDDE